MAGRTLILTGSELLWENTQGILVMLEVIREVFLEEEKILIDLKRKKQKNKTRKGMEAWWSRKCLWLGEY